MIIHTQPLGAYFKDNQGIGVVSYSVQAQRQSFSLFGLVEETYHPNDIFFQDLERRLQEAGSGRVVELLSPYAYYIALPDNGEGKATLIDLKTVKAIQHSSRQYQSLERRLAQALEKRRYADAFHLAEDIFTKAREEISGGWKFREDFFHTDYRQEIRDHFLVRVDQEVEKARNAIALANPRPSDYARYMDSLEAVLGWYGQFKPSLLLEEIPEMNHAVQERLAKATPGAVVDLYVVQWEEKFVPDILQDNLLSSEEKYHHVRKTITLLQRMRFWMADEHLAAFDSSLCNVEQELEQFKRIKKRNGTWAEISLSTSPSTSRP